MARQRLSASGLAKIFNGSSQPIYVIDRNRKIVFLNKACRDWLGDSADSLLACRCDYHSEPTTAACEATAAALCPPPQAMFERTTVVVSRIIPDESEAPKHATRQRHATCIPLRGQDDESLLGTIVLVESEDIALGENRLPPKAAAGSPRHEPPADAPHELIREYRRKIARRHRLDRLVGNSPAMLRARARVEVACGVQANVLIVGPSGSGRQHLATTIHHADDADAAGALIPLDCSVLGGELIHSTLAALSSADASHGSPGAKTLLLNHIDDLSPEAQADMAAVLLNRPFSMRVLVTAETCLDTMASEGLFRSDLACALGTITIHLPPLVERREDIPLLAHLFLEEINAKGGHQLGGFAPEALDRLDAYPWPGNLDELALLVRQSHARAKGPLITADELPERILDAAKAAAYPPREEETIVLDDYLARIEHELINRALRRARGNKAQAARLLGMTRPRFYRRLGQLGIEDT